MLSLLQASIPQAYKGVSPAEQPLPDPAVSTSSPSPVDAHTDRLDQGQGPTLKRTVTTSKYDASTAAVDDLAKYLTEAREQADAAEAKRAAQADQEFTPNWRRTGLPAKPSPLLVEADRLRAQGILDPKQPLASYHVVLSKEVLAPPQPLEDLGGRDAPPHYMATTTNLQNRSRTLIAAAGNRAPVHNKLASWHLLAEEELQQKLAASAARRKAMMQTMSNDQWDQEQKVIKNIKQKLSFLRNPRYVPPSSPTKREQRVQWGVHDTCKSKPPALKVSLTSVPGNYFLMEPAIIQFGDYQIGQTYEVAVKLRNVDHVGRRARLLPPATPFFSLSPVTFPAAVGVIAPGMHCEFRVYFTPHSLADYDDGFTIESDRTQLHIPVTARRPPPLLSLPGCIDLGHVVLGNVQVVDLPVHNAGGAGRFEVASLDGQPLAVQEDGAVAFGRFRLSPSCFALGCNETTQLQVTFSPDLEGDHHEEFKLVCDNGQQLIFTLYGRGAVPRAAMAQIDGHGISEQDLQRPLWFGEVVYGTEPGFERSLVVHNATPLPFPFVWRQTAGSGADAGAFSISPSQGSLPAGNDATFAVRFRPAARGRSAAQVQLLVDTSVDGHLQQYDHLISQIDLEGVGVSCAVEVQPSVLCCAGPMGLGQERRLPVTIHNHSNVVADLAWQNCDQCIAIERAELAIAPGAVLEAHVVVRALEVGGLHRRLEAHVSSGQPLTLDVSATVHGPKVEMQAAAVDFGLVRINTCATTELLLLNTSAECEAAWQLSEVVQADAAFAWPGLSFSQSQGVLPPSATIKLQVTFQAGHEGQLCSILRCEAEGGQAHHLSVAATVVAPRLALDRCLLDLANTYVGMLREERLLLRNMTMLPTRFAWQQPSGDAMQLDIHPAQGELGPGEQVEVAVMLTPLQQGSMEVAADCLVADMAEPLGFGVRTHAGGLAATYEISPLSQDGPPPAPSSTPHHAHQARPLLAHFGECCPLGSTQRLLLTVRNGSAIAAPVAVWLDTFGCPYSPPPSFGQSPAAGSTLQRGGNSVHAMHSGSRGSVHAPDSQAGLHSPHPSRSSHPSRASHRSATKRLPATIRLDNRHEHSAAFHGRTGQLAVSLRDSLAATRELSGSRGIAIAIASTTHMLPAWGVAQFELICYTDMVGDYTDVLHVQVGDLPIQDIPMRIGVTGTPLVAQLEHTLLRGLATASAVSSTQLALNFGQIPAGSSSEHSFHVFNTGSLDVAIEWQFRRMLAPVSRPADAPEAADAPAAQQGHHAQHADQPAAAETPEGTAGGLSPPDAASAATATTSQPTASAVLAETAAEQQAGTQAGPQDAVGQDGCPQDPTQAGTEFAGPKLVDVAIRPAASGVSVAIDCPGEWADGPFTISPATAVIPAGGKLKFVVRLACAAADRCAGYLLGRQKLQAGGPDSMTVSLWPKAGHATGGAGLAQQASGVELSLAGSFHAYAAPPPVPLTPLRIDLVGEGIMPVLEPEYPDDGSQLSFRCSASDDPLAHSSYSKHVILTNRQACPLTFSLIPEGPFMIASAAASVQHPISKPGAATALLGSAAGIASRQGQMLSHTLAPQEYLDVCMWYLPSQAADTPASNSQSSSQSGSSGSSCHEASGGLHIGFDNGHQQVVALHACVQHPLLTASAPCLDFGVVHVHSSKALQLVLTNPTTAAADWTVHEAGSSRPRTASSHLQQSTSIGPFTINAAGGTIAGRGLGMPKTQIVMVTYTPGPGGSKPSTKSLMFSVRQGQGCTVQLAGTGSLEEGRENIVKSLVV